MRLSKHQFCTILDIIKELMDEQSTTAKALDTIFDDCHPVILKLGNKTIDKLIDFLQEDVNIDGEDVAWYVFDCDMGASPKKWKFVHDGHTYEFLCDSHESFYASLVMWERIKGENV